MVDRTDITYTTGYDELDELEETMVMSLNDYI